jgi:hypothetical protein
LPLDAASALGGFLGRSIGRHLGVSRQALRNLRLAMPEIGAVEGWRVIRGMWDNLGRVIAEYPHLDKYVSLVNLASVSMLGKVMDVAVDPMRFRANFYLSGVDEWKERDWLGGEINLGGARLRVVSAITRCAATHVNPVTAERDLDIVGTLRRSFGDINMAIYAEVLEGGEIAERDIMHLASLNVP